LSLQEGGRAAGDNMTSEVEIRMMQAKECQQPPEAGRGKKCILPKSLWRKHRPIKTVIVDQ
jgi:hypothetical protein